MSAADLATTFRVTRRDDAILLHFLGRSFMAAQVEDFLALVASFPEAEAPRCYIFDFSACDYISSEGLGTIVAWWKRDPAHVRVVIPTGSESFIEEIFDMTGMGKILGGAIYPSVAEALV